jgi:hypothetical protein
LESANLSLSAKQIVAAIADAARRWCDADFPARVRSTRDIIARTGYREPVVDYALDSLFAGLDARTLRTTIASELGSTEALDGFVAREGRPDVSFASAGLVAVVSSSTTIGVAIPALAYALCAKSSVRVKDRSDFFVAAFAETVASERPELAGRMQIEAWDSRDADAVPAFITEAGVVVAYGSDATLAALRRALRSETRFIPYGNRTSVGYVAAETLGDTASAREAARGIAVDALLYDGEGCLSIHLVFVEREAVLDPKAFAKMLAEACDEAAVEFPAGYTKLDPAAAAIRAAAFFRAAQGSGAVFGGNTAPHLVILDPPRDDVPPWARRTIAVYGIDGPQDALGILRRHNIALEAVGTGSPASPVIEAFAIAAGASWIGRLGTLQRPPLGAEHGGVGRILPFVRAIYRTC